MERDGQAVRGKDGKKERVEAGGGGNRARVRYISLLSVVCVLSNCCVDDWQGQRDCRE